MPVNKHKKQTTKSSVMIKQKRKSIKKYRTHTINWGMKKAYPNPNLKTQIVLTKEKQRNEW